MNVFCDRCLKWNCMGYEKNTGGYWGKPIIVCFDCLSQHDQEEIKKNGAKR